jgi:hypothetical protein
VSTTGPGQSAGLEAPIIQQVCYHLPELLAEIKAERSVGLFAHEPFSQSEIQKIFRKHQSRHCKRRK